MKVTINVEGVEIELTPSQIESVVSNVNSCDEQQADMVNALAAHPARAVREYVGQSELVSHENWATLILDPCYSVSERAINNWKWRNHITAAEVLKVLKLHPQSIESFINNIENPLSNGDSDADVKALEAVILNHSDDSIRYQAAENSSLPKKLIKKLTADKNCFVAARAKKTLEDL